MKPRTNWLAATLCLAACAHNAPAPKPLPKPGAPPAATASAAATPDEPFRNQRPTPGTPGEVSYPIPKITRLENGLSLYFVRRPSRVVALSLIVQNGVSSEPEGKAGLAALTARLLVEATKKKPAAALAEAVESLGTTIGSDAKRDESSVDLTVLPQDAARGLGLLAEVMTEPAFAPPDFERVRAEWLDGLRAERQNPQRLASLAAVRVLHGPLYGSPMNGTLSGVQALGVADLRAFHQRAYTPDRAALVVVGDLPEAQVVADVTRLFRGWRGKSRLPSPPVPAPTTPDKTRILLIDRQGAVQSSIAAVQAFPKRADPGHEAREILGRALGGLFTSRLNTNLREKHGYTYGAFAQPVATQKTGTLLVASNVRTDVTAPALDEITRELTLIRDPALGAPLTPAELERGKADLVFSLGATLEHPSRVASEIGSLFVDGLSPDYHARYPALINAITPAAVGEAAQVIAPGRLIVVIVGDQKKIQPELERRGYAVESAPDTLLD